MKLLKSSLFLLFITIFMISSSAYAAQIVSLHVTFNEITQRIDISGSTTAGAGKQVTLSIIDPEDGLEYMNQMTSEEDSSFNVNYKLLNTVQGEYQVAVGGEGVTSIVYDSFHYSGTPAVILPVATIPSITIGPNGIVDGAQSTKLGTVYLVPIGDYAEEADLLAVDEMYRSQADVEEVNVPFSMTAPSEVGTYHLYAVDTEGKVSAPSDGIVTVQSAFDLAVTWKVGTEEQATHLVGGKMLTAIVSASTEQSAAQEVTMLVALQDEHGVVTKFATLPILLQADQSQSFHVSFRLPHNVEGYQAMAALVSGDDWQGDDLVYLSGPFVINAQSID